MSYQSLLDTPFDENFAASDEESTLHCSACKQLFNRFVQDEYDDVKCPHCGFIIVAIIDPDNDVLR